MRDSKQLQAASGKFGTFPKFDEFRLLPVSRNGDSRIKCLNV